jgi:hypothetical protein
MSDFTVLRVDIGPAGRVVEGTNKFDNAILGLFAQFPTLVQISTLTTDADLETLYYRESDED